MPRHTPPRHTGHRAPVNAGCNRFVPTPHPLAISGHSDRRLIHHFRRPDTTALPASPELIDAVDVYKATPPVPLKNAA
jgi:hypothetical protein